MVDKLFQGFLIRRKPGNFFHRYVDGIPVAGTQGIDLVHCSLLENTGMNPYRSIEAAVRRHFYIWIMVNYRTIF
ncbi:hypothetical protein ACYULU_01535 [Breznakiellaceae bacterium SP9]